MSTSSLIFLTGLPVGSSLVFEYESHFVSGVSTLFDEATDESSSPEEGVVRKKDELHFFSGESAFFM